MMEAVLRWQDDTEELLDQHAVMETPHPPGWGSKHYAAIIDFHTGVNDEKYPALNLEAHYASSDGVTAQREGADFTSTWVEATAMLAACERLVEALHARTPDAEGILWDFVSSWVWAQEHAKARRENRKLNLDIDDVDMTGRPTEEDRSFLIDVFTGFGQDIKDAMALGARRVTIEYS